MAIDFESLLKESAKNHGHLCPGQVLGVRLSMFGFGLDKIDLTDPRGKDHQSLIAFVEMDAIQSVTGFRLGHRTMEFKFREDIKKVMDEID